MCKKKEESDKMRASERDRENLPFHKNVSS